VRLLKGDYAAKTEYAKRPRDAAERWLTAGADWLHVVDLDAAKSGRATNAAAIADIFAAATEVGGHVQVGGGVREFEDIQAWLDLGATRVVVGTRALDVAWMAEAVRQFGGDALVAGLDGRGGKLAVRGWLEQTEVWLTDLATELVAVGVKHALVTDVDRDGTLLGANLKLAAAVQACGLQAIASGGLRDIDDVQAAITAGLCGAIAGKSLYDGKMAASEALALAAATVIAATSSLRGKGSMSGC